MSPPGRQGGYMQHRFVLVNLAVMVAAYLGGLQTGKVDVAAPTSTNVPRYEYCQYFATYFAEDLLDKFGSQGWDLVSFNTIGERPVNSDFVGAKEYAVTFKRQVGSGLKSCAQSRK
jgi:hypothetical protein